MQHPFAVEEKNANLHKPRKNDIKNSIITILTIAFVIFTDNLAFGTIAGLLLYGLFNLLSGREALSSQ